MICQSVHLTWWYCWTDTARVPPTPPPQKKTLCGACRVWITGRKPPYPELLWTCWRHQGLMSSWTAEVLPWAAPQSCVPFKPIYPSKKLPTLQSCLPLKAAYPSRCLHFKAACPLKWPTLQDAYASKLPAHHSHWPFKEDAYPSKI